MNFSTTVYVILLINTSNLSLKSSEDFKAVNHCSMRLLALMKRCQPNFFYGNSRDQISSYCRVSQETAENGFSQQRWPWVCSTMVRVQTIGNLSCVAFSNPDMKIMIDTLVIITPSILAGLFQKRNKPFSDASTDTAQNKGCKSNTYLPLKWVCWELACTAGMCSCSISQTLPHSASAAWLWKWGSVCAAVPSAPFQTWRMLRIR